jgi:membrane protease YdiL (CAAX protease family)
VRAFAWFFGVLLAAGLAAAALAYPVFELTSRLAPWPFHRVTGRIAMLAAVAGIVWLCRRLGVGNRRDLGYALTWRRFLAVALISGAFGIATASAGAGFLLAAHLRAWADPAALASVSIVARWLLAALGSGIAVALIEETVMRGAMHSAIAREAGQATAVMLTAPLFAVLHFFAKSRIPPDQLGWLSGFDLLARSFAPLGHPALVADSFLAWLAVSLVLSLTRVLTGNIAVAIGLHGGWVVVLRMLQEATEPGTGTRYAAWVGRFDGLLGYWLLPWAAAIALALWLTRRVWVPYACGADAIGAIDASLPSRSTGSSSSR